jgi:hypothetical protein
MTRPLVTTFPSDEQRATVALLRSHYPPGSGMRVGKVHPDGWMRVELPAAEVGVWHHFVHRDGTVRRALTVNPSPLFTDHIESKEEPDMPNPKPQPQQRRQAPPKQRAPQQQPQPQPQQQSDDGGGGGTEWQEDPGWSSLFYRPDAVDQQPMFTGQGLDPEGLPIEVAIWKRYSRNGKPYLRMHVQWPYVEDAPAEADPGPASDDWAF